MIPKSGTRFSDKIMPCKKGGEFDFKGLAQIPERGGNDDAHQAEPDGEATPPR
jgi:hypothetical protein